MLFLIDQSATESELLSQAERRVGNDHEETSYLRGERTTTDH